MTLQELQTSQLTGVRASLYEIAGHLERKRDGDTAIAQAIAAVIDGTGIENWPDAKAAVDEVARLHAELETARLHAIESLRALAAMVELTEQEAATETAEVTDTNNEE